MITATIALNAHGSPFGERLAHITIWNDMTGTGARGNYEYRIAIGEEVREGSITGFRRTQSNGALRLVGRVLRREFPDTPELRYMDVPPTPKTEARTGQWNTTP